MGTIKTVLILLFVLFLNACNWEELAGNATIPEDTAKVSHVEYLNPDVFSVEGFTDDEILILQESADMWCEASDYELCPILADYGKSTITMVSETEWQWSTLGGLCSPNEDWTDDIYIRYTNDKSVLLVVVLHELAHHFGCGHFEDGGLMSANLSDIKDITITEEMTNCMS